MEGITQPYTRVYIVSQRRKNVLIVFEVISHWGDD